MYTNIIHHVDILVYTSYNGSNFHLKVGRYMYLFLHQSPDHYFFFKDLFKNQKTKIIIKVN